MASGNTVVGTITGMTEELEKALKGLTKPAKELSGALGTLTKIISGLETFVSPFSQIQKQAVELAKSVGLASKSIMSTATRTIEQNKKMQLSMSYNISSEDMIRMQTSMMSKLGRNVGIDMAGTVQRNVNGEIVNPNFDSTIENLIAARQVFEESTVADIVGGFDKLGKSMKTAAKATGKLFQEAGEYGINLTQYTENFTNNLEMAQMYNFRNGVNGLKEMARKATEIRQDMKQIASFADKVGSVTGAVETAANLQVLGGSFAALSNPLAMLNESLTDMNGLQDRFNQMTAGAAHYNSVTHEIEMDPVTRQLMKRAAESMGVDPANLIDQAYAQARRGEIERQINANGIGGLREDVRKMLPNVAEIDSETGVAGATINGAFKTLSEIAASPELQKDLIEETRSESEDIKVIAKSVMGIEDMISGRKYQTENAAANTLITQGAVSGKSAYDMVLNFILEDFNPSLVEAAERVDLFSNSIAGFYETAKAKLESAGIKAWDALINSTNPGQARATISEEFRNLFGESPVANEINGVVSNISEKLSEIAIKIDEYTTSRAGVSTAPGNKVQDAGLEGREGALITPQTTTPQPFNAWYTPQYPTNYNTFGNGYPLFTPAQTNRVTFAENQQTMPSAQVAPTTQAQGGQRAAQEQSFNYTFNLTGNLTMDVNGDNGKIGKIDLLKKLQDSHTLELEISKIISETSKELIRKGLIDNP